MALQPTNARYTASVARKATLDNYVSTLDIHKPENADEFIKRYGSQNLTGLLEMLGSKAPVAQRTFVHWEEDYIHNYAEVSAATTATTATVAVKIKAQVDEDGAGAGTQNLSGMRLGDVVLLPDSSLALCVGLNANGKTIVYASGYSSGLAAANSTDTVEEVLLAAYDGAMPTLAANAKLPIVGNEWAEDTGSPEGLTPKPIKYENNVMIMKEAFKVSGTEATNQTWMEVEGPDGKKGYLWYLKGENDTYRRFQNHCEMIMVVGEKADSATIGANGYKGTEGLLTHIGTQGTRIDTALASWATGDIDDMVKALDRERGSKNNAFFCGINLSLKVDDVIADFNAGTVSTGTGAGRFGSFVNGVENVDLGFTTFTRGGYTFNKSIYDPFNYTAMLGASAAGYADKGFVVPMDSRRDAKSGDKIPSLRVRYKEADGYSREMEHWLTGSAVLQNKTDDNDHLKCHYRTERGLEVFGGNRFLEISTN